MERKRRSMSRFILKETADGIEVEAAFQYVNEFHENILGFCNNIYNAVRAERI